LTTLSSKAAGSNAEDLTSRRTSTLLFLPRYQEAAGVDQVGEPRSGRSHLAGYGADAKTERSEGLVEAAGVELGGVLRKRLFSRIASEIDVLKATELIEILRLPPKYPQRNPTHR